ncbi:MAG: transcriptional repressor [Nanoarchaeota archaeon]|nr:transcriptional repressor [Nanoarchaeota archaeon]MBU1632259.1 transcriptional repressor [Nanoarchaeota archaeon]MBU1876066.1 transcriptional repressor [Nanoarchaeota archaeon]
MLSIRKMRQTKQKKLIEEEIKKIESFFTAEELFHKVKKRDNKFGIATIYRFLRDLKKKEKLHSYLCNRKIVYSKDASSHCHFICQKCGEIKHFDVKSLDFLKIQESICHFQIDVHGTCKKCLKEK